MFIAVGEEVKKSPSSPFDISKFDVFASRDSPVTTPPPDANKVSMYSRHSRDNSQTEIELQQQTNESAPRSISPILAQQAGLGQKQVKATEEPNHTEPNTHHDQATGNESTSTSDITAHDNDNAKSEERDGQTVSPRTSAKLKLDELVSEHAHLIRPATTEGDSNMTDEKAVSEDKGDRALEFENLMDTDESSSEPPTSSSISLLDDDDLRFVN